MLIHFNCGVALCVLGLLLTVLWVGLRSVIVAFHCTVKPDLSDHSKIGKAKVLKTDGSLMQAESTNVLQNALLSFDVH